MKKKIQATIGEGCFAICFHVCWFGEQKVCNCYVSYAALQEVEDADNNGTNSHDSSGDSVCMIHLINLKNLVYGMIVFLFYVRRFRDEFRAFKFENRPTFRTSATRGFNRPTAAN